MFRRLLLDRKRASAKALWTTKRSPCDYAALIYGAAQPPTWTRVLEFGANWGGNLRYFLDRHPGIHVTGIDINPVVQELDAVPHARGIVGDESALAALETDAFDLAFTVSVLDHIPARDVVTTVIAELIRVAPRVLLLEPWLESVEGDVSGKIRNAVKPGLPGSHKPFAPHSYFWHYDAMLAEFPVSFTKTARPLHTHSFGPFYYVYDVTRIAPIC